MAVHGLVDGEVEEEGAHQELIDKDDMYALLVREQQVTGTDIIADDDQSMDEDCKTPEESASDEATTGGSEMKQLKPNAMTKADRHSTTNDSTVIAVKGEANKDAIEKEKEEENVPDMGGTKRLVANLPLLGAAACRV